MRIFIGTIEIGGQIPLLAAGFRALGHQVTTGVPIGHSYAFDHSLSYDVYLRSGDIRQVRKIILEHDIFLFQFGKSLLPYNKDFPMIRQAGKKIISLFNGSDIRYWPAFEQQSGINYKELTGEDVQAIWRPESLLEVLPTLRRGELYADLILSLPNQSALSLRPYQHFFVASNLPQYHFCIPGRDVPVIVHAPSNTSVKGTKNILAALGALKNEGIKFELHLLHGVQNSEVLKALADADCAIDQAILSTGLFSIEAMASGCAVAAAQYPHAAALSGIVPFYGVNPYMLKENLRPLLTDRELRIRLASEGHAYVTRYHAPESICQRILQDLEAGEQRTYDYWPSFYAKSFLLPEGIHIPPKYLGMSDAIVTRWGVPDDVDPGEMVRRGLASPAILKSSIPQWRKRKDCVRYYNKLSISQVSLDTRSINISTPTLFQELKKFSLLQILPLQQFQSQIVKELYKNLQYGNIPYIIKTLSNTEINNNFEKDITIALLLWGMGEYKAALHFSSTKNTDLVSLTIKWLSAAFFLKNGEFKQGISLLHSILSNLKYSSKGIITLDEVKGIPPESIYIISWKKPENNLRKWYSPASILPNWYSFYAAEFVWDLVVFMLIFSGYKLYIPKMNNPHKELFKKILDEYKILHGYH